MNKKLMALGLGLVTLAGALWLLWDAVGFVASGSLVGIGIGVALFGSGAVAVWLLVSQIRFGMRAERLVKLMLAEGDERCYPDVALRPSGRVDPVAATRYRDERLAQAQQSPDDWRLCLLLASAYEMTRDHRNAVLTLNRATRLQAEGAAVQTI